MPADQSSEAISQCVEALQGKWTAQILYKVSAGVRRFGALHREIPAINRQSLMLVLRKMETLGILHPEASRSGQQKEYQLTNKGETLVSIVEAMREWGEAQLRAERQAKQQVPMKSTMTIISTAPLPKARQRP